MNKVSGGRVVYLDWAGDFQCERGKDAFGC